MSFVLGMALGALMVFVGAVFVLISEPVPSEARAPLTDGKSRCPHCARPFSDWFVWDGGDRYCYPCWSENSGRTIIEGRR